MTSIDTHPNQTHQLPFPPASDTHSPHHDIANKDGAISATAGQDNNTPSNNEVVADLRQLRPDGPETIDCPRCHQRATTRVEGRSEGKKKFMNVFWWPLPGRKHWWEETRWSCDQCEALLATQKWGKNMNVLV
ncbi:hypothetical protein Micbo1qcDRAFT_164037 [Microdochium bolleyi]|uniref:LITAF domain-containing protein n=1 Tax=Microdochium bolleyi TaxID=196109 RepID=A0A136IZR5_9PEZI|nr:hypothetical protein Micbo1qcDRAFT_164037 [Microdochium bolleyi]